MNTRKISSRQWRHFALTPLAVAMAWIGAAHGAEYWLCAKSGTIALPGAAAPITIWGYVEDNNDNLADGCPALDLNTWTAALPALTVPPADPAGLVVHLRNELPEPTSLVIPGQITTMSPVRHTDPAFAGRVRSFTAEATVGTDQTYAWPNLRPGTYLYHSGTHPQVQVQMGLYGAVTRDAAAGQAYASVPYNNQLTLLFSEIDPVLHDAVANGRYGQPVPDPLPAGLTAADYPSSTIDYAPKYFLINGEAHPAASLMSLAAGNAGQTTLLRLLNAGLQSRSPVLQGHYMRLVAEDGNPYPYAREQYSAFLPALKTVDAVITPAVAATYPLYDRRLATTNPGASGSTAGGMLAFLTVASAAPGTPLASNDAYATNEDTPLVVAIPGVLGNDDAYATDPGTTASWLSGPSHGSLSLLADGSFTYTPTTNYNGADSFSYQAVSGGASSLPTTVSLTVNAVNDLPLAANDAYSTTAGATLNVNAPGVLGNDSDVDADTLTPVLVSGPAAGTLTLNADGSFSYAATTAGDYSFTYQASDGTAPSNTATVALTVTANQPPVAVNDTASAPRRTSAVYTPVSINVVGNDSDPNGNLDPGTVTLVVAPNKGGSVIVNPSGTVSYTPRLNFRGTENFSYRVQDTGGLFSNTATVRVNVK